MFDFHFGSRAEIEERQADYLVFVKRMLPRWVNSIPDSEYLAIHSLIASNFQNAARPVIVETGVGASSLVLLYHAIRSGGLLMSWDINGAKAAYLRSVASDTFARNLGVNIWDHWTFVPYRSTADHLGLGVLEELDRRVDFCFLDSEHTLENLAGELRLLAPRLANRSLVLIDDANYRMAHTNTAFINMQRTKLGLPPIEDSADNTCAPFYEETPRILAEYWDTVEEVPTEYARTYKSDIFWEYFGSDRAALMAQGMEIADAIKDRLRAWRVAHSGPHETD